MTPQLTDEMRRALDEQEGKPLHVVDPVTNAPYVLIRAELYDRVRPLVEQVQGSLPEKGQFEIPPGIRRSQEALRRDLPKFLQDNDCRDKWVLYHGGECLRFAGTQKELIQECLRRGLRSNEYYIGRVVPTELEEVEEIDPSFFEFDEGHRDAASSEPM